MFKRWLMSLESITFALARIPSSHRPTDPLVGLVLGRAAVLAAMNRLFPEAARRAIVRVGRAAAPIEAGSASAPIRPGRARLSASTMRSYPPC